MIRIILRCSLGIYIYLVFVFIQMDWFLKKTGDIAVKLKLQNIDGKGKSLPGQRHLTEFEHLDSAKTTTSDLQLKTDFKNCELTGFEECPIHCKNRNKLHSNYNKSAKFNYFQSSKTVNDIPPQCVLRNIVKHCRHFKQLYRYDSIKVTREEKNFPLAFGIKMHKHPEKVEKILRAIYRSHNAYCIHVDKKSSTETLQVINDIGKCFKNVFVIQDREHMVHASNTHVASEMKCMRAVLKSNIPWKYYINLSGQEFPLKTNLEMVAILQFFHGANDIETYDLPVDQRWKVENKFSIFGNSLAQVMKKQDFKYKLTMSKGHPYGLFSRDFVEFVFKDGVAKDIISWLKNAYAPEESVWATLVTLPWAPGGYPVEVRHMVSTFVSRAMIFSDDLQKCQGRFVRGYCQFGCGDLPWLQNRPEFFAYKLDTENDRFVLDCLLHWYWEKAIKQDLTNIDWLFYSRLPHVKYHRRRLLQPSSEREQIKKEWLLNNTRNIL